MVHGKNVMVVTFYDIFEIKMSWLVKYIISENLVFFAPTMTFFHDFQNLVISWWKWKYFCDTTTPLPTPPPKKMKKKSTCDVFCRYFTNLKPASFFTILLSAKKLSLTYTSRFWLYYGKCMHHFAQIYTINVRTNNNPR